MKKITVKHELNRAIGQDKSPIYVRVRFETKTTRYKSLWPAFIMTRESEFGVKKGIRLEEEFGGEYFSEEEFDKLKNRNRSEVSRAIQEEENATRAIIKHFVEIHEVNIIDAGISNIMSSMFAAVEKVAIANVRETLMDEMYRWAELSRQWKPLYDVAEIIDWKKDPDQILAALSFMSNDRKHETQFYNFLKPHIKKLKSFDVLTTMNSDKKIKAYEWLTGGSRKEDFIQELKNMLGAGERHRDLITEIDHRIDLMVKVVLSFNKLRNSLKGSP